jgi:hypothetical protein
MVIEWKSHALESVVHVWDEHAISVEHLVASSWLLPEKWNQACFDAIFYRSTGCIDIIQVTRNKKHKYKFRHLVPFLKKLSNSEGRCFFRFFVVVPSELRDELSLSDGNIVGVESIRPFHPEWTISNNMFVVSVCDDVEAMDSVTPRPSKKPKVDADL